MLCIKLYGETTPFVLIGQEKGCHRSLMAEDWENVYMWQFPTHCNQIQQSQVMCKVTKAEMLVLLNTS